MRPAGELELPTGELRQRPPAYSAVKVGGERAYQRARRGEEFEVPERLVTVYRFEQLARDGDEAEFEIECSSGTYVRSLIADLGDAYCTELRRLAIGPFSADEADEAAADPAAPKRSPVFSDHLVSAAVSIKVTPLTEAERAPARRSRSGPSTASTSATGR